MNYRHILIPVCCVLLGCTVLLLLWEVSMPGRLVLSALSVDWVDWLIRMFGGMIGLFDTGQTLLGLTSNRTLFPPSVSCLWIPTKIHKE